MYPLFAAILSICASSSIAGIFFFGLFSIPALLLIFISFTLLYHFLRFSKRNKSAIVLYVLIVLSFSYFLRFQVYAVLSVTIPSFIYLYGPLVEQGWWLAMMGGVEDGAADLKQPDAAPTQEHGNPCGTSRNEASSASPLAPNEGAQEPNTGTSSATETSPNRDRDGDETPRTPELEAVIKENMDKMKLRTADEQRLSELSRKVAEEWSQGQSPSEQRQDFIEEGIKERDIENPFTDQPARKVIANEVKDFAANSVDGTGGGKSNDRAQSPLDQFAIVPFYPIQIGRLYLSFTNASFYLLLTLSFVLFVFYLVTKKGGGKSVANACQSVLELIYDFVPNLVNEQIGGLSGNVKQKYFPCISVTFTFSLFRNLQGMIPYSFTVTSHFIVTLGLSFSLFIGITIVGFSKNGLHFLSFSLPAGVPLPLAPFLVLLELIPHCFRALSLGIRLFANMMAGHSLVKILSGFAWTMLCMNDIFYFIGSTGPFFIVLALTGLELGVAILQAYVFTILICIYLNDAINLH